MEDSKDIKTLKQIVAILEEMLFSIPMPIEVVKKYEFMRESATSKTGILLPPSKIWALQKVALERSQAEQKQEPEIDHFLKKLDTSYDTIKKYQSSLEGKLHSLEQL